jgi:hypothetical protein
MKHKALALTILALTPALSFAQGTGLSLKAGTLGAGLELSRSFSDSVSGRLGLNAFSYKRNTTQNSVNYDFKLNLETVSALADWYPWQSEFRTTAGLISNGNKATLTANPATDNVINGVTYTPGQIGSLVGTMRFNSLAPYIGIGWGNPARKDNTWGLVTDIGVLVQGTPKTTLVGQCGASITGTPVCAQLQSDVAAENVKLQSSLHNYKLWPVISIGASYHF